MVKKNLKSFKVRDVLEKLVENHAASGHLQHKIIKNSKKIISKKEGK